MPDGKISYARNGGVSIAWTQFGEGPIDLIFVPGFIGHLEIFVESELVARFYDRLGSFARVIAFDKRGFGLSDRVEGSYAIETVGEDIVAVLDAAEVERAVVFGVSEGGPAAAAFAATHPDRTNALIQFGTYARIAEAPDYPIGLPVETIRRLQKTLVDSWGTGDSLPFWAPSAADDPELRDWWARLLRGGGSPATAQGLTDAYLELDVRPLLKQINVPTLVMWRQGDRLVPPEHSKTMMEAIPGAKGVEMEGRDHLFFVGDQDAMLGEIEEFLTGERHDAPAERTLATVLFTDIVGSTERAAEVGDGRWRELLSRHDRIAAGQIERQRGRLVKSTGDGILATFDGPARAITAATGLRDRLGELDLQIRAGVHTGECELMGDDLGGMAVHIGARVSSAAGPGEVLVSQTVRDLVVGSGIEFEDRGVTSLKGVPGDWRLFAVKEAG